MNVSTGRFHRISAQKLALTKDFSYALLTPGGAAGDLQERASHAEWYTPLVHAFLDWQLQVEPVACDKRPMSTALHTDLALRSSAQRRARSPGWGACQHESRRPEYDFGIVECWQSGAGGVRYAVDSLLETTNGKRGRARAEEGACFPWVADGGAWREARPSSRV